MRQVRGMATIAQLGALPANGHRRPATPGLVVPVQTAHSAMSAIIQLPCGIADTQIGPPLGGGRRIASRAVERSNSRWPPRDLQISHGEIVRRHLQRRRSAAEITTYGLADTVTMPSWITPGDDHAHDGREGQSVGLPVGYADEGPVAEPGDGGPRRPGKRFHRHLVTSGRAVPARSKDAKDDCILTGTSRTSRYGPVA